MHVLVAFGSVSGGTAGLADVIGQTLRDAGHDVEVRDADEIDSVDGYNAVLVGGGLYASRWVHAASAFVGRFSEQLRQVPVWFFSSGPLDESASHQDLPASAQVQRLMRRVGAKAHRTFGGRLAPDATGFVAHAMAQRGMAGDFRDFTRVAAWALSVGAELERLPVSVVRPVPRTTKWLRRSVELLCLFTGVTALAGGVQLVTTMHGGEHLPLSLLEHSPFTSFLIPGLVLLLGVSVPNLTAVVLEWRHSPLADRAALVAGTAIFGWIVVELLLLRQTSFLQAVYLTVALLTLAVSTVLLRQPALRSSSLRTRSWSRPRER